MDPIVPVIDLKSEVRSAIFESGPMLPVTDLNSEACSLKADAEPIEALSATMRPFKKEDPTFIESLNDLNSEV